MRFEVYFDLISEPGCWGLSAGVYLLGSVCWGLSARVYLLGSISVVEGCDGGHAAFRLASRSPPA